MKRTCPLCGAEIEYRRGEVRGCPDCEPPLFDPPTEGGLPPLDLDAGGQLDRLILADLDRHPGGVREDELIEGLGSWARRREISKRIHALRDVRSIEVATTVHVPDVGPLPIWRRATEVRP